MICIDNTKKHLPSIYSFPFHLQAYTDFTDHKNRSKIVAKISYIKLKSTNAAATIAPVEPTVTALAAPLNGATLDPEAEAAALVPAAAEPAAVPAATLVGEAVGLAAAADDAEARMDEYAADEAVATEATELSAAADDLAPGDPPPA